MTRYVATQPGRGLAPWARPPGKVPESPCDKVPFTSGRQLAIGSVQPLD
jgi:hypothetical protein